MKIQLLAFGRAKELLGLKEQSIQLIGIENVSQLKVFLIEKYPSLASLNNFQIAINEQYALPDDPINENDIVAIIPPVSGG